MYFNVIATDVQIKNSTSFAANGSNVHCRFVGENNNEGSKVLFTCYGKTEPPIVKKTGSAFPGLAILKKMETLLITKR